MKDIKLAGCLEDGLFRNAPVKMDAHGHYDLSSTDRQSPAYYALKGFRLHNDLLIQDSEQRTEINLEALCWLNHAITINPEYAWGHLIRAKIYCELNKTEEALQDIRKAYKFGLTNEFFLYVKALIHFELGHFYLCLTDLIEAIELTKNGDILGDCRFLKVLVLRELGFNCFDKLSTNEDNLLTSGKER